MAHWAGHTNTGTGGTTEAHGSSNAETSGAGPAEAPELAGGGATEVGTSAALLHYHL